MNEKSPFARELNKAAMTIVQQRELKGQSGAGIETGPEDEAQKKAEKQRQLNEDFAKLRRALHLLAYTKPLVGAVHRNGKDEFKNFYAESEWRYIPATVMQTELCYLAADEFSDSAKLKQANEKVTKEGALAFSIADVRYVFVKTISEVPLLVDFINSRLGHYPANQPKVLVSRISSLEDLRDDI